MSAYDAPERRRHERRREDDHRFWRALKGERRVGERRRDRVVDAVPASAMPPAPEPEPEPSDGEIASVSPEDARRAALRNMLRAAEARQNRIGRARRPVLAKGRRVAITRGEFAGQAGIILDADYIDSRVLVRVDGREPPVWIPFSRVAAPGGAVERP